MLRGMHDALLVFGVKGTNHLAGTPPPANQAECITLWYQCPAPTMEAAPNRCSIEHSRANSDQRIVFDSGSMHDRSMSIVNSISILQGKRGLHASSRGLEHWSLRDVDRSGVAADHRAKPHACIGMDVHIPAHRGGRAIQADGGHKFGAKTKFPRHLKYWFQRLGRGGSRLIARSWGVGRLALES